MEKTDDTGDMYDSAAQANVTDLNTAAVFGTNNARLRDNIYYWDLEDQALSHSYGRQPAVEDGMTSQVSAV